MRAKYAGTCARTGKAYRAGTEIERYGKGWAIVQAARESEIRWVRTTQGELRQLPLDRPLRCLQCLEADGKLDAARAGQLSDLTPYTLIRQGSDFVCPAGQHTAHVLSEEEVWAEVTLPALHFTDDLCLNRKVGPDKWEAIKQYFRYLSYADLADWHDQMDNFDEAEKYEGRRGGEWFVRNAEDIPVVEDILGILPENRLAVLQGKWAAEAEEEKRAAQEAAEKRRAEEEAKLRLFDPAEGEYVPGSHRLQGTWVKWRDGHDIYGAGTEFLVEEGGQHVWLVVNNGMDGDDWSRNNVQTGGAGAIGHRFPLTPERLAFLRSLPGGERLDQAEEPPDDDPLTALHNAAMEQADEPKGANLMATNESQPKRRGGRRPGSGRPAVFDTPQQAVLVYLPPDLIEQSARAAQEQGLTRSEILRRALAAYLK